MSTAVHAAGPVVVEGDGSLAVRLRAAVREAAAADHRQAPGTVLVSVQSDDRMEDVLKRQNQAFAAGSAFLPCRVKGTVVEIGPLCVPGRPGCAACAQERHRSVVHVAPMHQRLADEGARTALPAHWEQLVCDLVVDRLATGVSDDTVHVIALPRGEVTAHRVTPVPDCPHCDTRPDDSAQAARLAFRPQPLSDPEKLRVKPLMPLTELRSALVDHRFGPIPHLFRESAAPMAMTSVEVATLGLRPRMFGYGRSPDFDEAQRVGLLEAVERESGSWPAARRTVVHGSYTELAADALDPALLGLPDPAYDGHPSSLLDPYSPQERTAWVWVHAFDRDAPVLVPEHVAYYGIPRGPGRARYLYECSNGCAVGGSLEEAVLYGCLEVMERDAFLLSWYSQTPGVRLSTRGAEDEVCAGLLECLAGEGYSAHLYDITTDNGMPVVWALALDPDNRTGASLSAAAAHPDPVKAVRGALAEVTTMAVFGNRRQDHPSEESRRAMLEDPTLVHTIDDHVALYTLPAALDRLAWLIDAGGEPVDVDERFGDWRARWQRADLTETLDLVLDAMATTGTPPVVIRQTTDRDARLGVEVVKVLAPGAVPVTFGHVHHRTRGLPRLDRARARNGVTGPVLPHPFP
ncbi:TOMM precursor leader peptide-binding protein [Streptomyces sp. NPDC046900]|uniref:TOMM precursor leader peptide-binding protein n=1 Tax=Streptomyces sp. NPDC046900 TaxID=3155473 RepID=UPI0033F75242